MSAVRPFAVLALFFVLAAPVNADPVVRGAVRAADGSSLAGARVELATHPTNYDVELLLFDRRTTPPAIATALTDAAGRFELPVRGAGTFRVQVSAAGAVPMRYFLLPLTASVELPPVVLPRNVGAEMTLVDGDGRPLHDAGVYVENTSRNLWQPFAKNGWRAGARIGWTDERGVLEVARIPGEKLRINVFSRARAAPEKFADGGRLTVTPPPTSRRTIEVRGSDGLASPGVMVAGPLSWPLGRTGEDGRLTVELPVDEEMTLHLLDELGRRQSFKASGDDEGPFSLQLASLLPISGRVTQADGEPIPGALVWPTYDPGRFAITDGEGIYRLEAPRLSRLRVQAEAAGFLPRAFELEGDVLRSGVVPDLALDACAAVTGRLVDADGNALAGAEVVAELKIPIPRSRAYRPDAAAGRSVTDADGNFRVDGLDAVAHVLTARRLGYTDTEVQVEPLKLRETRPLGTIVMATGRLAFGRVVDLDQRPLEGAEVQLRAAGESTDPFTARTDADGRFELSQLPGEKLDITAQRQGFAPMTVRGVEIPADNKAVDLGTLILGPGVSVRGVVTDPESAPIFGARIYISPSPGNNNALVALRQAAASSSPTEPDATADDRGEFVLADLTPGLTVDLLVDGDGYLSAAVTGATVPSVEAPDLEVPDHEPLQVVLRPAALVAGSVEDEAGHPIAGAEVSLRPAETPPDPSADGLHGTAVTDDRGEFVLADVADGEFLVAAFASGYQPSAEAELEIAKAADVADLRFVLVPGATLEGWVSDRGGEPVEGAKVRVGRPLGTTDAEGHYRIDGLPTGSGEAQVEHPGYNRTRETLEIEAGVNRADFVLDGGHEAGGRVIDEDRLGIGGASVELEADDPLDPRQYRATSDADGRFYWSQVADGKYFLRAAKDGYATARLEEKVEVLGGPAPEIEVTLRRGAKVDGRILGLEFEDLERVRVEARTGDVRKSGSVDFDGGYEVIDLSPGDWQVRASLGDGRREATARVTLEPGVDRVTRDLEFGGGLTLTGEVLYDSQPLVGAEVTVAGSDVAVRRQIVTDAGGRFEIEDLLEGNYRLGLAHFERAVTYNEDFGLYSDRHLTIELDPSGISGMIISADGTGPIEDALVALRQLMGPGAESGSLFTSGSDATGAFRQDHLPAGRYQLTVRADGYEPAERSLELLAGTRVDGLEIPLRPVPGLALVVHLASGSAAQIVNLRREGGGAVIAESRVADHQGRVLFATVPPGDHRFLVSAPGGAVTAVKATVPGEPVAVVLPAAGELEVRVPALLETDEVATVTVLGTDGRPFTHLEVGASLRSQWTMVAGRAIIDGLPAGSWILHVTHADGRVWSGSAVTTGGPAIEVVLDG